MGMRMSHAARRSLSLGRATRLYVYRMPDVVPRAHGNRGNGHLPLYRIFPGNGHRIFPAARLLPAPWPPAVVCSCLQREGRVSAHLCNVRIRRQLIRGGLLASSWLGCHLWFLCVLFITSIWLTSKKK